MPHPIGAADGNTCAGEKLRVTESASLNRKTSKNTSGTETNSISSCNCFPSDVKTGAAVQDVQMSGHSPWKAWPHSQRDPARSYNDQNFLNLLSVNAPEQRGEKGQLHSPQVTPLSFALYLVSFPHRHINAQEQEGNHWECMSPDIKNGFILFLGNRILYDIAFPLFHLCALASLFTLIFHSV